MEVGVWRVCGECVQQLRRLVLLQQRVLLRQRVLLHMLWRLLRHFNTQKIQRHYQGVIITTCRGSHWVLWR